MTRNDANDRAATDSALTSSDTTYDLMILGAGMAGMAAALYASSRGLKTALAGSVGGIDFSTGLIDLMAVHPVAQGRTWENPWDAIKAVCKDEPEHPYARIRPEMIKQAVDDFTTFLLQAGLPYAGNDNTNTRLLSPAGTIKRTYRVPRSMWNGALMLEEKAPCLLADFKNLKGFSTRQIVEMRKHELPHLRDVLLSFPGFKGELYTEHMAMAVSRPGTLEALVESLAPHVGDAAYVGFPAALGLYGAGDVQARLEEMLGVRIFEIPTMPPSVAGLRLRAVFEQELPRRGVALFSQKLVQGVENGRDGTFRFHLAGVAGEDKEATVGAKAAVLATGRFFGKGLAADRIGVRETVFNLPVAQPKDRGEWHRQDFYDPKGHPLNRVGVEVDASFRPLDDNGRPFKENLFAAGSILAHQDWMRMKCGAGLAAATAYAAVAEIVQNR